MNKLFTEFENENVLRAYPFASGCTMKDTSGVQIGTGILIDAALYPVNPVGDIYLSKIGVDGTVSISDSRDVIMTATVDGGSILEFYDTSAFRRHTGTIVAASADALAVLTNVYSDRAFQASETMFASSCVFPIVNDGVMSINVGGTGAVDGNVAFANGNEDQVRVSTSPGGDKLRFDVIPQPHIVQLTSIQHIYCVVDGRTPFRIQKVDLVQDAQTGGSESSSSGSDFTGNSNTIALYLDNIDRQDICGNANREDAIVTRDTCGCDGSSSPCTPDIDPPTEIPEVYQVEVVDISNGADGAFYLTVPNMFGYDNPLSITMKDGVVVPTGDIEITDDANADNLSALKTSTPTKGIVLQVPGMAPTT